MVRNTSGSIPPATPKDNYVPRSPRYTTEIQTVPESQLYNVRRKNSSTATTVHRCEPLQQVLRLNSVYSPRTCSVSHPCTSVYIIYVSDILESCSHARAPMCCFEHELHPDSVSISAPIRVSIFGCVADPEVRSLLPIYTLVKKEEVFGKRLCGGERTVVAT